MHQFLTKIIGLKQVYPISQILMFFWREPDFMAYKNSSILFNRSGRSEQTLSDIDAKTDILQFLHCSSDEIQDC